MKQGSAFLEKKPCKRSALVNASSCPREFPNTKSQKISSQTGCHWKAPHSSNTNCSTLISGRGTLRNMPDFQPGGTSFRSPGFVLEACLPLRSQHYPTVQSPGINPDCRMQQVRPPCVSQGIFFPSFFIYWSSSHVALLFPKILIKISKPPGYLQNLKRNLFPTSCLPWWWLVQSS